jgi:hemolysin activation/secretion protein
MNVPFARLLAGSVLALAVNAAWAQQDDGIIRFEIQRFEVSGNTLLPQAEVMAAVAPFTGTGKDFGDVQRALEALEKRYHAIGYKVVVVELPEQELDQGVVKLKVVEVKLGKVIVTNNTVYDEANIRRSLPSLQEGKTPNLFKVSPNLKNVNDNPSKKVKLKLQSGEADDEVNALIEVTDKRAWSASLNLDNTGGAATGKTNVSASLQHANLWNRDHVASIQYTTTAQEPDQVAVYGMGYHIPLYERGDSLDFFANYSNVDSGSITAGIFTLAVSGKGAVAGARYNQVLTKRGEMEHSLIYGIDHKAFKNSVLLGGTDFGNDVTVHPLSINYVATKPVEMGEVSGSLTLIQNIGGGSRGGAADFTAVRLGSRPNYRLMRLSGSYVKLTEKGWQLRALANVQLTTDALIPGEQFGAGGASTVRGMDERALSADSGVSTNLEVYTPSLCKPEGKWQCRVLAFMDGAYGKRNKALPGEMTSTAISSVGLGLRLAYGESMNLQMDWGRVIHEGRVATDGAHKLHVRVGFAY